MAIVEDVSSAVAAAGKGASVVQLRAPHAPTRELVGMAAELVTRLTVPLVVSSRVDAVLAAGAAGVNLPERDISVAAARQLLGPGLVVGRSVHSLEAGLLAAHEGADYVIFGPVFATPSHAHVPAAGLAELSRVAAALPVPVIAIGGLNAERVRECLEAGAGGYAGISMFR